MGACGEVAQILGCENSDSDHSNSSTIVDSIVVVSVLTTTVNSNSRGEPSGMCNLELCVCARVSYVLFVY